MTKLPTLEEMIAEFKKLRDWVPPVQPTSSCDCASCRAEGAEA